VIGGPDRLTPAVADASGMGDAVVKSDRAILTFYWVRGAVDPFMLMPDERALLRKYCHEHPVVACPQCSEALTFERLGSDIIIGRRDFCPTCRADLTAALRLHLATCTLMRAQAREIRERARHLVTRNQRVPTT
jgi:hypothetical protein